MKCLRCGREMVSTTGGNENCPRCGFAVNDLVLRPSNCDMPLPEGFGKSTGWICPVCGRGLAPWTSFCPCKGSGSQITYGGTQVGVWDVTYLNSDGGSQSTATDINSVWNKYGTNTESKK